MVCVRICTIKIPKATLAESLIPDITKIANPRSKITVIGRIGRKLRSVLRYSIATFPEITAVATYESIVITPATEAKDLEVAFNRQLYAPPFVGNASTTSVYTDL